jgi:thiamine-phosphate pyrophosphorylase
VRSREAGKLLPIPKKMPLSLRKPIIYLITSGETTETTTPASEDFSRVLTLIEAAATAKVNLVQIREKHLTARVLYALTTAAVQIIRQSDTKLLVNDRADIARDAGADGVHLTTTSLSAGVVREMFGEEFIVGVSTHSLDEVIRARDENASFAVFGPVFDTASKQMYGEPIGLQNFNDAASRIAPFPLLALGGVDMDQVAACFGAGASGIAAIRLFREPAELGTVVARIREVFPECQQQ